MGLDSLRLSVEEKRFLYTAISVVEMYQDKSLPEACLIYNLSKRYNELGIAEIREKRIQNFK